MYHLQLQRSILLRFDDKNHPGYNRNTLSSMWITTQLIWYYVEVVIHHLMTLNTSCVIVHWNRHPSSYRYARYPCRIQPVIIMLHVLSLSSFQSSILIDWSGTICVHKLGRSDNLGHLQIFIHNYSLSWRFWEAIFMTLSCKQIWVSFLWKRLQFQYTIFESSKWGCSWCTYF